MKPLGPRTALLVSIPAIAASALFIKKCGMDFSAIAFYRMAGAAAIYFLISKCDLSPIFKLPARMLGLLVFSGVMLAAHFFLWIKAFDHTDVTSNLLLLVTQPLFAVLLGSALLGERPSPRVALAVLLALAGCAVIVFKDSSLTGGYLLGDMLCVGGSLALAVFFTAAKPVRRGLGFAQFNFAVFAVAAVCLLVAGLAMGTKWTGYGGTQWIYIALIIAVPTCIGHALMNYAVRYAKLFTTNITIVGEPVLGIFLAWLFIDGETIHLVKIAGGLLLVASIFVAFIDERNQ